MALIAAFDLEICQYDAVNAFINAELSTPIFCNCPEGYKKPGSVLKVLRALYGLKESPYLWHKDITATFKELGLYPVPGVNCLYINKWLILLFFVDDFIIAYLKQNEHYLQEFKLKLFKEYEIRKLDKANHFLGIRIIRDRPLRKLWLIQDAYIDTLALKFKISTSKAPKIPLPEKTLLPYEGKASEQ
jgi:hypothetical protein